MPSRRAYLLVFVALMVLLGATWYLAHLDLGGFNPLVAIGIAFLKMLLVALFFMHLLRGQRLLWVIALLGLMFWTLVATLTVVDALTR